MPVVTWAYFESLYRKSCVCSSLELDGWSHPLTAGSDRSCAAQQKVRGWTVFPSSGYLTEEVDRTGANQRTHRPGPAMDEQAGPGVFFNNNNSGLPGGGNIKAPQTGDFGGGEAARAQYNIPGILHFLQHEWARFEVERAQWEVERAELQVSSPK